MLTSEKKKKIPSILIISFLLCEGENLGFTLSITPMRYSVRKSVVEAKMSVLVPVLSTYYE